MKVSSVGRSATVAWGNTSEHANLLAAGTVAGAISEPFEPPAHLEIFQLDLAASTKEMKCLGSVQAAERFHRLAWGTKGVSDGSLPYGLLAGGMVDGTIKVYNPAVIMCALAPSPLARWLSRRPPGRRPLLHPPPRARA